MTTKTCSMCGAEFEVPFPSTRRHTCSSPCRREMQRRNAASTRGKGERRSAWIATPCYGCGTPVVRPPWMTRQRKRAYCSPECRTDFAPKSGDGRPHRVTNARRIDGQGYVRIYLPVAERPPGWKHSHYPEHRQVMRKMLGRDLLPGENAHHINGDKTDNRPENLELWITSQPKGQRASELLAWAREIVATYEPVEAVIAPRQ